MEISWICKKPRTSSELHKLFQFSFQFLKHEWEAHASKLKIYIFILSIR